MVSNVVWSPTYDLRATTEDGKPLSTVSFHYRASIMQNTGEDWRDTAISVSTASPGSWTNIPSLRSMKIAPTIPSGANSTSHIPFGQAQNTNTNTTNAFGFGNNTSGQMQQQQQSKSGFGAFGSATQAVPTSMLFGGGAQAAPSTGLFGSAQPAASAPSAFGAFGQSGSTFNPPTDTSDGWTTVEPVEKPDPNAGASEKESAWAETKAVVTEGAFASAFRIEGNCTIPSEPTAHKVAIAILSFEAKVNYIAVPRSAPVAFLQVRVFFKMLCS